MAYTIKFVGLDKLESALLTKAQLGAVKTIVKKNGARLQQEAQRIVPVDTGTLQGSIGLSIRDAGLTAVSGPTAHYGGYVEMGTRFMSAQPYMRPAFNIAKGKLKSDLKRLMK